MGACAVRCRMLTAIPGFYPLSASDIPYPSRAHQKCLQMLSDSPHPLLERGCRAVAPGSELPLTPTFPALGFESQQEPLSYCLLGTSCCIPLPTPPHVLSTRLLLEATPLPRRPPHPYSQPLAFWKEPMGDGE